MGRRNNKPNRFAQRKRERKERAQRPPGVHRTEPYQDIVRENENFMNYYRNQNICPDTEWESFITALKSNLPTTFRVTGSRGESKALLELIQHDFFEDYINGAKELKNEGDDGISFEKPLRLPWYPDGLAWQLQLSRKDIRRSESLFRLHNFLIAETSAGGISRQEAVSMIPPIVLDVKPHHKVLDMCAAPGSKTAQLIEALHANDDLPTGFVVANDIDNNRCYMLVHQAKRMNSPCFMVINHDSSQLPNLTIGLNQEVLKFDRILCDVPCSGDGTMRKNPDIWQKWTAAQGLNLHGIQYRVAKRGAEMLAVGGRLVYSTCSLNPIENEAVLYRLVKESEGALEIVNAADLVPGLKFIKGMTQWRPASRDIEFYDKFEDVPEKWLTTIRPQMFAPPTEEEAKRMGLENCMRLLPHLQDTGGFFVAVLIKKKLLPWEKQHVPRAPASIPVVEATKSEEGEENSVEVKSGDDKTSGAPWGPQRKKRRLHGYKEDPFVFFDGKEDVWESIKAFYDIAPEFDPLCLLTRCVGGKKKNIYFCSEPIRQLVQQNEQNVKIINTGVKAFSRCDNKNSKCAFRLAQEGLYTVDAFVRERKILLERDDLVTLLQNTDPQNPPQINSLSKTVQDRTESVSHGSCVLKYKHEKFTLTLVGWRGTQTLRAYIDANETVHMLRLLGADISKYDVNKFKKVDEITDVPDEKVDDANGGKNGESIQIEEQENAEKMIESDESDK